MSKYAMVLALSGIVPFILSFWPPLKIWRHSRALLLSIAVVVFVFGGWDIFAVFRGHWSFAPDALWPARVIDLPVEEVLFFVVIPFCCIFTWEALKYIMGIKK